MANATPTSEEQIYRKSMSISRIRAVVTSREWQIHSSMVVDIRYGYNCTQEQAESLLDLGVMNGYIEVDDSEKPPALDHPTKTWNKYRIKD